MTEVHLPRLNWEASATATHPQVSSSLPSEVETCLKNARFVSGLPPLCIYISLTCDKAPSRNLRCHVPHISLMNYTYLPSTPFNSTPVIIMTTNPTSKKTLNLINNPRVSSSSTTGSHTGRLHEIQTQLEKARRHLKQHDQAWQVYCKTSTLIL